MTTQHVCTSNTRVARHQLPSVQHVVKEGVGSAVEEKEERVRADKTCPNENENCFAVLQVETSTSGA